MESLAQISQRTSIDRPPAQLQAILDLINQMPKVNKKSREVELASLFYFAYGSVSLREALKKYKDPSFPTCYPGGTRRPPFPTDFLTLSTIHKIKGSGFKNVYYLGTDDSFYKRHHLMKGEKKQQEILLMNVACSRAKKKLTLLFPISKSDFKMCDKHPNPWNIICKIPRACYKLKKHLVWSPVKSCPGQLFIGTGGLTLFRIRSVFPTTPLCQELVASISPVLSNPGYQSDPFCVDVATATFSKHDSHPN